jgi:signal transduction histidine kinase
MLRHVLDYQLDVAAFALMLFASAGGLHVWLRRRQGVGFGVPTWGLLGLIVATGALAAGFAGHHESNRLRDMLQGIAPTYAQELERMGHAGVVLDTPADDPRYLSMIDAEIRWTRANSNVADVYTFRMRPDGAVVLLVDAETDYNHNGVFDDDDREGRTDIGEAYDEVSDTLRNAFAGTAAFDPVPVTDRWGTWISAYVPMRDATGAIEAVLGVDYDASAWLTAIAQSRAAALGFVALAAAIALAATTIVSVTRAELARRDATERALVEASRRAGMAEVATGVLHNVGNVLNSVNVSAGVLADRIRQSKVPALGKVAGLIRERRQDLGTFLTSDQRGKVLPEYLLQLAGLMSSEQEQMLGELTQLAHSVNHIKQIVAAQQSYARAAEVIETFELRDVVEEAIKLSTEALDRHSVELVREFAHCGPVTADRQKVLQILVNLMSNAKDAMRERPDYQRKMTLRLGPAAGGDGGEIARVSVTDTGTGIKPEDMPNLFHYGFTTRDDGHGFGLHFSSNAAKQMKGNLTAHSDGPGRGATFTLDIPFARSEVTA